MAAAPHSIGTGGLPNMEPAWRSFAFFRLAYATLGKDLDKHTAEP